MLARLKKRLPDAGSLGGRALRAGGWNMFQMLGLNVLKLGSNLIMTRLLLPDAFALLSFVFIVITAVTLATDIGIRQSIIREEDGDQADFLRTAWLFKIARGVLLAVMLVGVALVLAASAPLWAAEDTVYADVRLPGLLVCGAIVPLLIGLQSANREGLERQLSYKPWALLEISAQAISIVFMVAFAQISATVWALMAGALMTFVVKAAGSHIFLPGPPMRWSFDRAIAWRIWHFGKWLMGASVFTFVGRNADKLIFGALLNITTMGLLTVAYVWLTAGQTVIQQILKKVAYPVLSEIKRDRSHDLGRLLARIQRLVDLLCVTAFVIVLALGPWLVRVLYTETYYLAGHFLALLGAGFLCLRFELLNNLMLALGDSRGMMWLWVQRAAILVLCLPTVYNTFGLTAALVFVALHPLAVVPFVLYRLRAHLDRQTQIGYLLWLCAVLAVGLSVSALFPLGTLE